MDNRLKIFFFASILFLFVGCDGIIMDKPEIDAPQKVFAVNAEGGSLDIEIKSTGIDTIIVDDDCKSWITVSDSITSKALFVFNEYIQVTVTPNTQEKARTGKIHLYSFNKSVTIKVKQNGK